MDIRELKHIGLTSGEIKIYSALLDLGECTRTVLAKRSGISPSKIYDVANRLIEKGLISSVKKNGVIHFSSADPERIRDYIGSKKKELEREMATVDELMPSLIAKYKDSQGSADVQVFSGWEGMKTAYEGIAKAMGKGDTNYIFGASIGKDAPQADRFFASYYHKVDKRGYKVKVIFNEDVRGHRARVGYFEDSSLHEIRYLHTKTFSELNLYEGNVLFVMLLEKPIVVRIRSQEAYDSALKFFQSLWKQAA